MAEYIKTLKEDNGDITYPVTQAGAVLLSGGGDLETTLNGKASQTSVNGKISVGDVRGTDLTANAKTAILNMIYPVGSIFMSATMSTVAQVQTAFGGTWVAWGAGRVPVGVNSSDTDFNAPSKTGGSKTVTLTESQLPKHRHPIDNNQSGGDYNMTSQYELYVANNNATLRTKHWSRSTGLAGGGEAHPNMPPYITCYMYKRTA